MRTKITELFNISYPVMSAPMTNHSGGRLAAAVSKAGGLGSFGGIHPSGADWVREQIELVRSQTDNPFAVGFLTQYIPDYLPTFQAALEEKVPAIAFSFADPTPWLQQAKTAGAITLCQVQDLSSADQAVAAGADVLVVQGNAAGGHTGGMNLLPFLSSVVDRYPEVPVMASGGISDGRTLAGVLAAGAEGAWLGTAFVATTEAIEVPEAFKEVIVRSDGEDTVFTDLYDRIDNGSWPEGVAARVYRNPFVEKMPIRTYPTPNLTNRFVSTCPTSISIRNWEPTCTTCIWTYGARPTKWAWRLCSTSITRPPRVCCRRPQLPLEFWPARPSRRGS